MGDSDDEYNSTKRNRDKFHRERDDFSGGFNNRNERRDWSTERKDNWKNKPPMNMNPNYPTSGGIMQPSYGHGNPRGDFNQRRFDSSPPYKKNKKEWENGEYNRNTNVYANYTDSPYPNPPQLLPQNQDYDQHQSFKANQQKEPDYPTQPPCLSFKQFLQQQDDSISDDDAIKKYNEYKIEFKKKQINEFFLAHKEEEWFKSRYHPDEYVHRNNDQKKAIIKRLETFMELYNKQWLNNVAVEIDKTNELLRFLDAAVIKIEGGDDFDLLALEPTNESSENQNEDLSSSSSRNNTNGNGNGKTKKKRRKQKDGDSQSGSESGAYSDSSSSDEGENGQSDKSSKKRKPQPLHRTTSIFLRNLPPSTTKEELESLFRAHKGFKRIALSDPAPERGFFRRGWVTFEADVNIKEICWSLNNTKIRDHNPGAIINRDLNKRVRSTNSFICHHKSIVKNDIKIASKIIQNFDKRWNLWNNSVVDVKTEVKAVDEGRENEETNEEEKQENNEENVVAEAIVKNKRPIEIIPPYVFTSDSNPLLENITDYLVDEMNAEEEELLGANEIDSNNESSNVQKSKEVQIDLDEKYRQMLDKLILYLRVVHSFDYYNYIEYQQEDSMPNRCGIIHARAPLPSSESPIMLKQDDVNAYIEQFEQKIKAYLEYKDKLDDDVAKKLGLKDKNSEIEKFIQTNTVELASDRWLCPLSGKKFKGPEFIRKHLFYKHADKIQDVEKEVEYFNNYLMDPKRPQLSEHPSNKQPASVQQPQQMGQMQPNQSLLGNTPPMMQQQQSPYIMQTSPYGANRMPNQMWQNPQSMNQMGNQYNRFSPQMQNYYGGGNGNMGRNPMPYGRRPPPPHMAMGREHREIVHYKDLDAPDE